MSNWFEKALGILAIVILIVVVICIWVGVTNPDINLAETSSDSNNHESVVKPGIFYTANGNIAIGVQVAPYVIVDVSDGSLNVGIPLIP